MRTRGDFVPHSSGRGLPRLAIPFVLAVVWLSTDAGHSEPLPVRPPNLQLSLERLANTGSVLMIGAHPDDENTALLTYLALGRRLRTAYLSLTRGEGGQNVIGPEQGSLLGVIRTQELLAARRIDGGEQYFTSAVDFGYSKTADETLQKWNRKQVVADIVQVIRQFQPDVIILCWTGTAADGHGQHQASNILAREAIDVFTKETGKAPRVFVFRRKAGGTTVEVGGYDPLLGASYTQIAGLSRSQHQSQAMGSPQTVGPARVFLDPVGGPAVAGDILAGISTGPERLDPQFAAIVAKAIAGLNPRRPQEIIPILLQARRILRSLSGDLAARKIRELDDILAQASGLVMEVSAERPHAAPGTPVKLRVRIVNRSSAPIRMEAIDMPGVPQAGPSELPENTPVERTLTWTAEPSVPDVTFQLRFGAEPVSFVRPVLYRYVDKVLGDRTQPFAVIPPVSVSFPESTILFPSDAERQVSVTVRSYSGPVSGAVSLKLPKDWSSNPQAAPFELPGDGAERTLQFRVTPGDAKSVNQVSAVATTTVATTSSVIVIRYPHIPTQTVVEPAMARFVRENIRVLAHKVGYIAGAGDEVPAAIRQLGCSVTFLTTADLTTGNLSEYDAIVTGVRAFNLRDDLRGNISRLIDYVREGGALIVQYNLADYQGLLGPYPITIGRDRISVEEAPVRIMKPDSPVLKFPNLITAADFEDWVQERGLYFPSKWDAKYDAPIESADPGEAPLRGGVLFTRFGEGAYIYTSYSWFRQLPAGVPGAYRIFANMLSQ